MNTTAANLATAIKEIKSRPATGPRMSGLGIPAAYYMTDGAKRDRMLATARTEMKREQSAHQPARVR